MQLLDTTQKNNVLNAMVRILDRDRDKLLEANKKDLDAFDRDDQALYDRLVMDSAKIDGMIRSVREVMDQDDPVGREISRREVADGLEVVNRTAPFGTILIIYESRPDVTIEAAVLAFKSNNKIFLKGGKEAKNSNLALVKCWHAALEENDLAADWIRYLQLDRAETREFLKNPPEPLDLIVPRGGERLIAFVKENASCAVLVSGRGNNFLYVAADADWEQSLKVILNAKTHKISACNALDKILLSAGLPDLPGKLMELARALKAHSVEVLASPEITPMLPGAEVIRDENTWYEEFLALKCCIGLADVPADAISRINKYSGGHSATIMTRNKTLAREFMEQVDCAAVYHNASTRFTDGGQMGVGAELAISTDKLHHRGPLGLNELVTNKYYVFGDGHIRV